MKDWFITKKRIVITVCISLLSVLIGFNIFITSKESNHSIQTFNELQEIPTEEQLPISNQTDKVKTLFVDIKGAVHSPGVYEGKEGERISDIVNRAGGLTAEADEYQINLAKYIEDEMLIIIPKKGEEVTASISSVNASVGKVNINLADDSELMTLPNIGPSKASAIIQYRTDNGPFKTIEDLKLVTGIGDKTFEKLKDLIIVK